MPHASRSTITKTRKTARGKNAGGPVERIKNLILPPFMRDWGMRRWIGLGLSCFFALWLGAIFIAGDMHSKIRDGLTSQAIESAARHGFIVDDVLVEGRENLDKEWLKQALSPIHGAPLFAVDLNRLSDTITRQKWVKATRVQRIWPDRIKVRLWERTPTILKPTAHSNRVIVTDETGYEIGTFDRADFPHLPLVSGAEAAKNAYKIIPLVHAEPVIYQRLNRSEYIGQRRWDLVLDGNIRIKLPEDDMGLALRRLAMAQEETNILSRNNIKAIDLRDHSRIVIEIKDGENEEFQLTNDGKAL